MECFVCGKHDCCPSLYSTSNSSPDSFCYHSSDFPNSEGEIEESDLTNQAEIYYSEEYEHRHRLSLYVIVYLILM